ncbi:MAG: hypothetical protein ABIV36_19205 [Sphingobium limneticum]
MSNINAFCDTISAAAILNREERRAALQDVDNLPGFNRAVLLFAGTGEISNMMTAPKAMAWQIAFSMTLVGATVIKPAHVEDPEDGVLYLQIDDGRHLPSSWHSRRRRLESNFSTPVRPD